MYRHFCLVSRLQIVIVLSALVSAGNAHASMFFKDGPPREVRTALKQTQQFTAVYKIDEIPLNVRQAFTKGLHFSSFGMAEPGARWQEYDIIRPGLPTRRLKCAFFSKDLYVIFFEQAGWSKASYSGILKQASGIAKLIWSAQIPESVFDLRSFLKIIDKGEIQDFPW